MTRHRRTILYLALALAGAASLLIALLLQPPAHTIVTWAACAATAAGLIGLVVTINQPPDNIKPGDHIYTTAGDYLGVVTRTDTHVIHFSGPRKRDGLPVTYAGRTETYKGKAPEEGA